MGADNKIENGYITVEKVLEQSYIIPTYQRGYRWDADNVGKLLEDIYEDKLITRCQGMQLMMAITNNNKKMFNLYENESQIIDAKNPYCIQPLVLCKEDGKDTYIVIDGQQRLTSIAIIIRAIDQTCKKHDITISGPLGDANLEYLSRPGSSEFLNGLGNGLGEDNTNLDYMYMYEAFKYACNFFEERFKENSDNQNLYFEYLYNILMKNTRFIWYCIDTNEMDAHEVFANFNSGKLELTNAELIKALFMDKANYSSGNIDDRRIVISEKWDEIENALHNPDFWAFVPHKNQYGDGDYDTRIDVIFELFLMSKYVESGKTVDNYIEYRKDNSKDRYLFDEIEKWLKKELQKPDEKNKIMNECWYEIRKVYLGLQELYETDTIGNNSNKIYNMAGLYINLMNRKDNTVDGYSDDDFLYLRVYDNLYKIMKKPRSGKGDRIEEFRKLIREELDISESDTIENVVKKIRYSDPTEVGGDKRADRIVKMLLVYNIALLNNSEGIGQRFNFKAFAELKWQREHIFASNVDEEKNKSAGLDTVEERKTALKLLAIDIDKKDEEGKYDNPYMEYLRNVYFCKKEFPPKIKDEITQTETEFVLSDDGQVDRFRERFYDTSQKTLNSMLARAIRANQRSKELLAYYELLEQIETIASMEEETEKHKAYYGILKNLEIRNKSIYSREYLDITDEIEKCLSDYPEQNNYTVSIGKFTVSIDNQREKRDAVESILTRYSEYVRDLIMDKKMGNTTADEYILKDSDMITEWEELKIVFEKCRKTISSTIDQYFDEDFAKQLADNTMGNQTLLTGGVGGESQNQIVSNKSYKLKKQHVREFLRDGQFVPIGTLMVFSDTYNDSAYTSNFWLPDSRMRYLESIIETLDKFLHIQQN